MPSLAKEKCIELIEEDNNLSSRKIANILSNKNLADVSKTTIINFLIKHGYTYKAPKLKIKNLQPQKEARYDWVYVISMLLILEVFSFQMNAPFI